MMNTDTITTSSGNVFADLGFEAVEAAHLQLRAQLMIELESYIHAHRLTQAAAAQRLGISQSRVSDLTRGKIDRFSLDSLVTLLTRIGKAVTISIQDAA